MIEAPKTLSCGCNSGPCVTAAAVKGTVRCEGLTLRGRRCGNWATMRHNAVDLCPVHHAKSVKVFADAERRWKDAGEPEVDL